MSLKKIGLLSLLILCCIQVSFGQVQCGATQFWSRVQVYNQNEFVQYGGVQYKALLGNTGQDPTENPGTWLIIDSCATLDIVLDCSTIPEWDASVIYEAGDQAVRNDGIYQSLYWNSGNTPETNVNNGAYAWIFVGMCESTTSGQCDDSTPSFEFDLSGSPDSAWVSPQVRRDGLCCDVSADERPPFRCVEFFFTLDEDAIGIIFDIESGAVPPGALFFQINCEGRYQFGELLCLSGPGPFRLTFCKPGNNPNTYVIQSVGRPKVGPPVTVSDGCTAELTSSGYELETIQWTSVPSNPEWESYLSCTEQCDTVTATYQEGAPDSVVYQVSGFPPGGCLPDPVIQEVTVYFVNEKTATILPQEPMVCYGETDAEITVYPDGGRPPHQYLWSTGETTQTISVGEGYYSVEVFDNTTCPSTSTDVTVGAYEHPIVADAGPDQYICVNTTGIQLDGNIEEALGGVWSGGQGTFSPNDSTLNAIYIPTSDEITNGNITLTLTSTGNRGCTGDSDEMQIFFNDFADIQVPDTLTTCPLNPLVTLDATYSNAYGIQWSTPGGGTILPNDSADAITFVSSPQDTINGYSIISVTTIQSNDCPAVTDSTIVVFHPLITLEPLYDTTLCLSETSINLSANHSENTQITWSSTQGTFSPNDSESITSLEFDASEIGNPITVEALVSDLVGCRSVNSSMTVNWFDPPMVDAGPDINLCKTETNVTLSVTSTGVSDYSWSSINGNFDDNQLETVVYNISSEDTTRGYTDISVLGVSENGCGQDSDVLRLFFRDEPEVEVFNPLTVCKEVQTLDFYSETNFADSISWSTTGDGELIINSDRDISYTIDLQDTSQTNIYISATVYNEYCDAVTNQVPISFRESPMIETGNSEICEENPEVELNAELSNASNLQWLGGTGSFFPDRFTENITYTPSNQELIAGNVQLQVTTYGTDYCSEAIESINIPVIRSATVDLGDDLSICADQTEITLTANITNSTQGYWLGGSNQFMPDSSQSTITYLFDENDYQDSLVTLFYTTNNNNSCDNVSDNIQITLFAPITVDAGPDITICELQDTVIIPTTLTHDSLLTWRSTGTGSFLASDSTNFAAYIPSTSDKLAGNIDLIVSTLPYLSCNQYSDTLTLNFDTIPELNLGPDISVCDNQFPIEVTAQGNQGAWLGQGDFLLGNSNNNLYIPTQTEIDADTALLVFETYSYNECPALSDSLIITLFNGPSVDILPLTDQCASDGEFELEFTFENATNFRWTTSGLGTLDTTSGSLTANYTPSDFESTTNDSLVIRFQIEASDTNFCQETFDTEEIILIPRLNASVKRESTICSSEDAINLSPTITELGNLTWNTTGTEMFLPNNTSENVTYTLSENDKLQDSIVFVLSSVNDNACLDQIDSQIVFISPEIELENLRDTTVCEEEESLQLNAEAYNYTSLNWATSGNGSFFPDDSLSTIYRLSLADTVNSSIDIYISYLGNGICNDKIDTLVVSLEKPDLFSNGLIFNQCKDVDNFQINEGSDSTSTFLWSIVQGSGTLNDNTSATPIYTFSSNDYDQEILIFGAQVEGNSLCVDEYQEVEVLLDDLPILTTEDYTICESDDSLELIIDIENIADINWTTSFNGALSELDTNRAQYIHALSDSVYDVIEVNIEAVPHSNCQTLYDTISIQLENTPYITAPDDDILCIDENQLTLSAAYTNSTGASWSSSGTGFFSSTNASPTYFFTSNDKTDTLTFVAITEPHPYCPQDSDTLLITFSEPPAVLAYNQTLCDLDDEINLSPTIENALSFQWSSNAPGVFSPSDTSSSVIFSGSFSNLDSLIVNLMVSSCVSDSVQFVIYPDSSSNLTLPDTLYACENETNLIETNLSNVDTVYWSTSGSGLLSVLSNEQSNYTISFLDLTQGTVQIYAEGTNPNGCPSVIDSVSIITLEQQPSNFNQSIITCPEETSLEISTNISNNETPLIWSTSGSGIFEDTPENLTKNYNLTSADVISGAVEVVITQPEFECLEQVTDSIFITFYDSVKINAGEDLLVCSEDASVRVIAEIENATSVIWTHNGNGILTDSGATNPTYFFTDEDVQTSQVDFISTTTGTTCAPATDTVSVFFFQTPYINLGEDLIYCNEIPEIPVNAEVENATSFSWFTSGNGAFLSPLNQLENTYQSVEEDTVSTTIELGISADINGSCIAAQNIFVTYEDNPTILMGNTSACEGDTIILSGTPVNVINEVDQYLWTRDNEILENVDSILSVTESGNYGVQIILGTCLANNETAVTFIEPPAQPEKQETAICLETDDLLTISSNNTDLLTYWYFNEDTSMTSQVSQGGLYKYDLISPEGCSTTGEVSVLEVCAPQLFVTTIFSPNNDGKSEEMVVASQHVYSYDLKIFNRWGEVIFWTTDLNEFWDGHYRNELMPEGVYNWIITYSGHPDFYGEEQQLKGAITLIR